MCNDTPGKLWFVHVYGYNHAYHIRHFGVGAIFDNRCNRCIALSLPWAVHQLLHVVINVRGTDCGSQSEQEHNMILLV